MFFIFFLLFLSLFSFAVCNQFSRGVFAMLGAVSPDSFDTLHSYSNTFQMPFVTPWFPEKVLTPSSGFLDFAISMRPDYYQAIIDTVRYYGWDRIIYMYDSHDGIPLQPSSTVLHMPDRATIRPTSELTKLGITLHHANAKPENWL
ncbi:AAEL007965-PA [Aedes aegypti]|uniref:AAEL007965-PA n=1 Tax=Aedes aegypti TaxID=7159 RepID=Q170E1_AEDAE|nr:AAEL007965-PA [Aedes aegypti]